MKKQLLYFVACVLLVACKNQSAQDKQDTPVQEATTNHSEASAQPMRLSLENANVLAELPLSCIQTEYPNMIHHRMNEKDEAKQPHELYPAFHGCYDWHSSVHGHWSLVKLLKTYPELEKAETIRFALQQNMTKENILQEVAYFEKEHHKSFERTYGWAWLLKLSQELYTWNDPTGKQLKENLQPLTDVIRNNFINFLPKLKYPVRVGEHTNTAFGLSLAWDYAQTVGDQELSALIVSRAKDFYWQDQNCPMSWEPSGYDFLSPCLEEMNLMRRVLDEKEFSQWVSTFLPALVQPDYSLAVGEVADRTDGKLVHLDGLNFSRAWSFYGLAKQYPQYSYLIGTANKHVSHSLPNLVGDHYEGGHWLGTFAIYALEEGFVLQ
ncbi:DUF2891 domain-containing protein [Limibacter armeniacum]|uniref:DUF2891 domain-containing protein n=1 Tax=Limibacter armeniacum TaxID=466084 RepID=UPI002FE5BD40